jgi:hypothetical protein
MNVHVYVCEITRRLLSLVPECMMVAGFWDREMEGERGVGTKHY